MVGSAASSCCCETQCCATDIPQPEPQPVSAAPGLSFGSHLLAPVLAVLVRELPQPQPASSAPLTQAPATGSRLYARNCILLI